MDYVLETFWKRLKDILETCYQEQINSMIRLENVLKTSLQVVLKISSRRLQNVLKTSWRRFCKTSWRRFEDVLKMSWRNMTETTILVLTKMSSGRYEEVFWRRMKRANTFVLIDTSSRRPQDVFWRRRRKTSSRCLQDVFIKTNIWWVKSDLKSITRI